MTDKNFVPSSDFIQMLIHDDESLWLLRFVICKINAKHVLFEMAETGDGYLYHGVFDHLQGALDRTLQAGDEEYA